MLRVQFIKSVNYVEVGQRRISIRQRTVKLKETEHIAEIIRTFELCVG